MWVVNVILIFGAIAVVSWIVWNYGGEIARAFGVLFTGGQSVLLVIGVLLLEAVKAAVIAALVGGVVYLIFYVAKAPDAVRQGVGFSVASLVFFLIMLKALWENINNLRWTMRHEIRNRYRRR
jgi:hypothetical protein